MIPGRPCPRCGASIETDQRYCVECGERMVPALSLPYPYARPMTTGSALRTPLRAVSTLVAATLGFGVVVGTAMSPALSGTGAMPAPLVAQTPREAPKQPKAPAVAPPPATAPVTPPPSGLGTGSVPPVATAPAPSAKVVKPKPQMLRGTVVQVNRSSGSYALAQSAGPLVAIHARRLPELGARVRTPVRTLLNGTYAEDGKRKTRGTSDKATFSGIVTFRDDEPGKDFYTVSSTGTSVLVRMTPDGSGAATPPPFASSVTVTVRLGAPAPPPTETTPGTGTTTTTSTSTTTTTTTPSPPSSGGCDSDGEAVSPTPKAGSSLVLTQTELKVEQQSITDGDLAGTVQAVCPGTGQLVFSADGARESERDIVVSVPGSSGIDLHEVSVGSAVIAGVELKPPSGLVLHGIASDQGIKGASTQTEVQGSL
jgi:hypothetical protein